MSFINWGSESPEQLAIRRQLEERLLFEQAVRVSQARNRAGNTPGVAGGGGSGAIINTNILEITVDSTEYLSTYWCVTSSAPTTFTVDWGDGNIDEYNANGNECFVHNYEEIGIWNVVITFANPELITELEFND